MKSSCEPAAILLALALIPGCSVVRPVAPAPTPATIAAYLQDHPRAILQVTDTAGRKRWLYDVSLRGDTLHGLRTTTMPREPAAFSLDQIRQVAAPRFSAGRTLGLVGALVSLVGVWALMAPEPQYGF